MKQESNDGIDRRKLTFTVECFAPVDASIDEVKAFIEDSLEWAGGCLYPGGIDGYQDEGHPMFHSLDKVVAKQVRRERNVETKETV